MPGARAHGNDEIRPLPAGPSTGVNIAESSSGRHSGRFVAPPLAPGNASNASNGSVRLTQSMASRQYTPFEVQQPSEASNASVMTRTTSSNAMRGSQQIPPGGQSQQIPPGGQSSMQRQLSRQPTMGNRMKHYASLLVAEKPLEAHRQWNRKIAGDNEAGQSDDEYDEDDVEDDPSGGDEVVENIVQSSSVAPAAQPQPSAPLSRNNAVRPPASTRSQDAAYRKRFKTGKRYQTVRRQILRNKRRRGRTQYVHYLKKIYNSIVPAPGQSEPTPLKGGDFVLAYSYMYFMMAFDALTPSLLGTSSYIIMTFMAAALTFAGGMPLGLHSAWLVQSGAASEPPQAPSRDQRQYGPEYFWDDVIRNNAKLGHDLYMVQWGAVGPAIMHSGGSWRYIASTLLAVDFWHHMLLLGVIIVSGALIERRYGFFRIVIVSLMLAITGSMAAVLSADTCAVIYNPSPLAWGLFSWWLVDTIARTTFWQFRDWRKLRMTLLSYKNWTTVLLTISSFFTLLISEISTGESYAGAGIAAALSSLCIAPAIVPRWSRSIVEALSVPLAALGVLVFWVAIPLAGYARVSSVSEAQVLTCDWYQSQIDAVVLQG